MNDDWDSIRQELAALKTTSGLQILLMRDAIKEIKTNIDAIYVRLEKTEESQTCPFSAEEKDSLIAKITEIHTMFKTLLNGMHK